MAWTESRKKQSGGGGQQFDILIDCEMFGHVGGFDSIPLPANYLDYDHLAFAIIQDNVNQDYMKHMLNAYLQQYVNGGYASDTMLIVDSEDIEDIAYIIWSRVYNFPMLQGTTLYRFDYASSHMNTTEILGYSYGSGWQNLYMICFGFND